MTQPDQTTQSKDELELIFKRHTLQPTGKVDVDSVIKEVKAYTSNQVNAVLDELLEKKEIAWPGIEFVPIEAINAMKRALK